MKNYNLSLKGIKRFPIYDCDFKWVGGVLAPSGRIYGIPNKSCKVLEINPKTDEIELWGNLYNSGIKKWTGGCWWNGYVYGFPRGANTLLKIDIENRICKEIPLDIHYQSDHHYSGVLTPEGKVYQPARLGNTVLIIDLNTYESREIVLKKRFRNKPYLNYGGIYNNGKIYFFPRGKWERVLVFDTETEKMSYCKGWLHNVSASAGTIGPDGLIYAYSSYYSGMLQIDPKKNKASIILKSKVKGGHYGTKVGTNGKLYSIPGDADIIYEYDVHTGKIKIVHTVADSEKKQKAKCAGGYMDVYGNLWGIPAMGNFVYKMEFGDSEIYSVSELMEKQFDFGCY